MTRYTIGLILATSLLAGCTMQDGDFPSLAKRPYESEDPIAEPVGKEPETATSLPPALASQVADLESRHAKAESAFRTMLPSVQAVVTRASGAAEGSEAWADANVKLSRLDYARNESVKVVGEIDALVSAQRESDSNSDQPMVAPLLEERQKAIADAVDLQDAEINRLAGLLGT